MIRLGTKNYCWESEKYKTKQNKTNKQVDEKKENAAWQHSQLKNEIVCFRFAILRKHIRVTLLASKSDEN